jgi:hypothetical protein
MAAEMSAAGLMLVIEFLVLHLLYSTAYISSGTVLNG